MEQGEDNVSERLAEGRALGPQFMVTTAILTMALNSVTGSQTTIRSLGLHLKRKTSLTCGSLRPPGVTTAGTVLPGARF